MTKKTSFQSVEDLQVYLDSVYKNKDIDSTQYINFFDSSLEEILLPKKIFAYLKENISPDRYLGYSDPYGLKELRESIGCYYFNNTSLYKNIIVTSGAQQALYLLMNIWTTKKRKLNVGIEEFSYVGYKHIAKNFGAKNFLLGMDKNGIKIKDLKIACQKNKLDVLYIIPFLQNPTGINYSKKRIQEIFVLQKEFGFKIIADVSYSDLVNDRENQLKLTDLTKDNVYVVGTFSKILAADLRVGWIFSQELTSQLSLLRRSLDLFQPFFIQRAISNFLIYDAKSYLENLRKFWDIKRRLIVYLFELINLDKVFKLHPSHGGFYLWLEHLHQNEIEVQNYLDKKLLIAPGTFFGEEAGQKYLRLCYSRVGVISFFKSFVRISQIYNKNFNIKTVLNKITTSPAELIALLFKYLKIKLQMKFH